ncbi:MAG: DUF4270 family protein [Cyclobacteriaceae bacterium]
MKNISLRKIDVLGKGLMVFLLGLWAAMLISCEDPGILNTSQKFSNNNLQTIYVDTFSVVTSTVLADSLPTSNTSTVLVGGYNDKLVGWISSSSYLELAYLSTFLPDATSIYDSIGLVLPYNRYSYGDTTKAFTLSVHELTQTIKPRTLPPYVSRDKTSSLIATSALYNTSKVAYSPTPITSSNIQFYPRRDSVYIPLPISFGKKWYDIAKADTSFQFKDPNRFISEYFKGIYLTCAAGTDASIIGFKANKVKIRLYYRKIVGDNLTAAHFDFPAVNSFNQFNNITADRSATQLAALVSSGIVPSTSTEDISYVQSGVGLYTKIEFPTLKAFLKNPKYILIDAQLDVPLVQRTYTGYELPISPLAIYATDQSNILLGGIPSGNGILSSTIFYDKEYGLETKYSFSLINFISSELSSDAPTVTPLAVIPSSISSQVSRVAIGNRFNPTNKIKLKIYYSQYGTN